MEELSHRKRAREAEADSDSTKAKKIREDLLSLLEDSDTVSDRVPASHDLDSVIRSFEEEISACSPASNFIDLTSDTGDQPLQELGQVSSDQSDGIGGFSVFQDELPAYDSFGLWLGYESYEQIAGDDGHNQGDDYVALDGIFDYSDVNFGLDFPWQHETLPAL